jgi:perosamine synthetase
LLEDTAPFKREELMNYLNNLGVETRPVFFPINIMPPYLQFGTKEDLLVSNKISSSGISLPSSANLKEEEILYICNGIESFLNKYI